MEGEARHGVKLFFRRHEQHGCGGHLGLQLFGEGGRGGDGMHDEVARAARSKEILHEDATFGDEDFLLPIFRRPADRRSR